MLDPARFDAVEQSPELADAMQYEPEGRSSLPLAVSGAFLALAVFFVGSSLALVIGIGAPLAFVVVWALMSGGFVALAVEIFRRAHRFHAAPIVRHVAVVLDKRTHVTGSESSTSTSYYTTLAFRDGSRVEAHTPTDLAGLLTRGDIGVAYVKLTTLVAFRIFVA